jgi:hypothetical protein
VRRFDSTKSAELPSTIAGAGRGGPTEIHLFVPGLHERDPLRCVVVGIPRFTFTSRAVATSLITPNRVKSLVNQVPYEDFALA